MKTLTNVGGLLAVLGMAVSLAQAAEMRIWTSRKGLTMEAELGSITKDQVVLINKEGKEIKLKTEDLSLADRQHLVEFGGADASVITTGEPGFPEKEARIEASTIKKLDSKLKLGDESLLSFDLYQSSHFLVAPTGKVRGHDTLETAERLWHGMAFQHMNFRKDWGDKRMLILMVENRDVYKSLGSWYVAYLSKAGQDEAAQRTKNIWNEVASNQIALPPEPIKEYNLHENAVIFNIKDASSIRKALSPFPTHVIASALLGKQMGGVTSFGAEGYFAIVTGHAYYKEISLTKKTETHLLDVSGSQNDDITSKQGFKDGTSWARTLHQLVRRDKVKVALEPMLKWKTSDLTPERLVLIYAFAYYMESDAKRLCAFAKLVRQVETSNQIPPADEIAKFFGFSSVAAFDADWKKFITEGAFK